MSAELGFTTYGHGPLRVLVLHDWFCDHSSWDATLPYLTQDRFTYVFGDLRGYGSSREIEGTNTLDEAAGDAIAPARRAYPRIGDQSAHVIVSRLPTIREFRRKISTCAGST
jgi:3-oxoadipate enol-lactonase